MLLHDVVASAGYRTISWCSTGRFYLHLHAQRPRSLHLGTTTGSSPPCTSKMAEVYLFSSLVGP